MHPPSKDEGLKDTKHKIILTVNSGCGLYLGQYDTLLQNVAMRQLFYSKTQQKFITKYVSFLLENATVITKCGDFITKCDSYYKM